MMEQIIQGYDIDEVLYKTALKLVNAPEWSPRNQKTKELINQTLIIKNPENCVIQNPARKLSIKYAKAELEWFHSGEKNIAKIKDYASLWGRICDENEEVNSNYGEIVFHQKLPNWFGSQADWVLNSLKNDKDSRQALINYNQPKHKYKGNKDFVCTISTQYFIRDNKLIGITNKRSNDLIYGFSYDFIWYSYLQQHFSKLLKSVYPNLKLGENYHNVASLHVYEKHFQMLEDIIQEYEKKQFKSKTLQDIK